MITGVGPALSQIAKPADFVLQPYSPLIPSADLGGA